ncbi:MAG: hypothetical protein ACK452_15075 [Bacteroidota bacterium]|jgi:hypothetical protein
MSRYIHIADSKSRDAEIIFTNKTKKSTVKLVTDKGKDVHTLRVLKGTSKNSFEGLMKQYSNPESIADAMLSGDPEIDLQMTGRFVKSTTRVYIDKNLKPVTRITKKEIVHAPDGSIKEERIPKELMANILGEFPLKPGKLFPKKDIYNKLVFAKKYQLHHINGLTFDFLFDIAKELHEKEAMVMIGGGAKGNEPLVFQDGGKSYRAFLEGRVKDQSYILLIHLSNLELKGLNNA